jgi:hypothetical protein
MYIPTRGVFYKVAVDQTDGFYLITLAGYTWKFYGFSRKPETRAYARDSGLSHEFSLR